MTSVDVVKNCLADEVIGDCEQLQLMLFQKFAFTSAIGIIGQRFVDFKMVAPAGQFQTVIAKFACFLTQRFQWQIRPLARKQKRLDVP